MQKATLSTKVPLEMAEKINQTGYCIADVIQVGIEMFLSLNKTNQADLMFEHLKLKQQQRALSRMEMRRAREQAEPSTNFLK